ncbi:MAG: hypothetical protein PHI53_03005 [Candidatus Pacebacteria bacterium]|nr:hypothetical protein [Candidatus Paceibacterota bacterium]
MAEGIAKKQIPKDKKPPTDGSNFSFRQSPSRMINYIKYDYRITLWRSLARYRIVRWWLGRYSDFIRRSFMLLVSVAIAFLLNHFIELSALSNDLFMDYFISIGVMAGGIIAIVFSLSIFAQQSAVDLYSSQFFETFTHDKIEKINYFIIVIITLLFFGAGIFYGANSQFITTTLKTLSVYISLFLIGIIFVLIDLQYRNVRRKTNPIYRFNFLEKKALEFLDAIHKDARRIARILKLSNKETSEELAIAAAYKHYLQPHIFNLDRQIENLFEITMKLSAKEEIKTTNRGLSAVCNILGKYIHLRADSSVAFISSINFLATESDSQDFLTKTFERLNNAGERFITTRRVNNAVFVIDVYRTLARVAKETKFINRQNENPTLDHIKGYLSFYIDFAMRSKDYEVTLQGSRALVELSLYATEKNLQLTLYSLQDDLLKVANFGIETKVTFLTDECIKGWLAIIGAVFLYQFFDARHQLSKALDHIKKIVVYMNTAVSLGYLRDDFTTRMSMSKAYDEMMLTVSIIVNTLFKLKDEKRKFYKNNLLILFEETGQSLRVLSEEIKNCDSVLIDSVGRLFSDQNELMLKLFEEDEFKDRHEELFKNINRNIHLPTWFIHHAKSFRVSNAFRTLIDSTVKTALLASDASGGEKLMMSGIEALNSIVTQSFEKNSEKDGLDEPRLMLKMVFIGVLALKKNKQAVFKESKAQIKKFEKTFLHIYKTKYIAGLPKGVDPDNVLGIPKKDQLLFEVLQWRHDFMRDKYNRHRLMNDSREIMLDKVESTDIDNFISKVWGRSAVNTYTFREYF